MRKEKILFICTNNSARSQMAETFLNIFHGDRYEGFSAGIEATTINPYVVKSMAELGIDISIQRSKSLEEFKGKEFDYIVTVCNHAKEVCPFFPGKQMLHKNFTDPSTFTGNDEEVLKETNHVRDEIKDWIDKTFGIKTTE